MRSFKYQVVSSPSIIKKVELRGKQLQFLIDQKPIQNISTVRVAVFNTTGRNYDDVQFEIAFSPINGKAPILVQAIPQTPPETFDEVKLNDMNDNRLRLGYKLKVCNQSNKALFYADYIFEGEQAPDVSLTISKKGVDIVETPITGAASKDSWLFQIIAACFGIGIGALSLVFPTKRDNEKHAKESAKLNGIIQDLKLETLRLQSALKQAEVDKQEALTKMKADELYKQMAEHIDLLPKKK